MWENTLNGPGFVLLFCFAFIRKKKYIQGLNHYSEDSCTRKIKTWRCANRMWWQNNIGDACCCFEVHVCTARRPFPMEQRPQMDAVWAIQWGLGVSTSHTSLILQLAKNSQDDTPLLPQ
ncbi:uncharacterized protein LOC122024073 [Zingiber officinale]|uniref:uncharacterized protein LOC122024073 n=1 Tax=Zingiber officinale TaxID=94328 RepID=UPI001C4C7E88|nr:uncharacterized protein LOC122024073 [Zingiber officinale]